MCKSKHIKQLSNLIEAVNTGLITISNVRSECKLASDYTERTEIAPDKFMESIELLDKTIFKDAVDIYFEFSDAKTVLIKCGMKEAYMDVYFYADYTYEEDNRLEVETALKQSIFDKLVKSERKSYEN